MTKEHPSALRRTMIKSTVGRVRRTSYDLPDAKNPNHAYGFEIVRDPESAGEVIGKWVQATPSPAAKSGRSFIETNRQAILSGHLTAGETRKFANDHPDIIVKPAAKSKAGFVPTNDLTYGIKSKESEDINALVQARYTSFSTENADYPDFSNMKIKGKLPLPRETRASQGKDVRFHSSRQTSSTITGGEPDLFKMSKFKKVGSVLCTQPNAYSTSGGGGSGERDYYQDDRHY